MKATQTKKTKTKQKTLKH